MKWIKASERLPETNMEQWLRVHGSIRTSGFLSYNENFNCSNGIIYEIQDVEWLDESPIKEDGEDELWKEAIKIINRYRPESTYPIITKELKEAGFVIQRKLNGTEFEKDE